MLRRTLAILSTPPLWSKASVWQRQRGRFAASQWAAFVLARPSSIKAGSMGHSSASTASPVLKPREEEVRDTIIIGSGPAGYTAALYTARAQMNPLMVAGVQWGGQLQLTSDVENFPGYADAISGPDLMEDLRKQAERFGTDMMFRDVSSVDLSTRPFKVSVRKREYFARSLIIATGAEAIWLGAEGEEEVKGKGVSTCATCDGAFYDGDEVIVVGGGDSAMEEALFLTKFASKVTIVHRREGFRSSKIMLKRVQDHPKIELKLHRTVKRQVRRKSRRRTPYKRL